MPKRHPPLTPPKGRGTGPDTRDLMKATITLTPAEMDDLGIWEQYQEAEGISEWARKEGRIPPDEPMTITLETLRKMNVSFAITNGRIKILSYGDEV